MTSRLTDTSAKGFYYFNRMRKSERRASHPPSGAIWISATRCFIAVFVLRGRFQFWPRGQNCPGHITAGLLLVENEAQGKTIEAEAVKNVWTSRELELRLRPLNLLNAAVPEINGTPGTRPSDNVKALAPKRGMVGIYKIGSTADALSVDLGFTSYPDLVEEPRVIG